MTVRSPEAERAHELASRMTVLLGENARLKARVQRLEGLLRANLDTEPCEFDHHGNCQTHYLGNPCEVEAARRFLAHPEEEAPRDE